ncbi:phosphatase PAP2 family protein [Acholeplasma sp. OttesenSCG-928-E16]|nr:phosphatase PAP2 family protein [Acholeplasma sp. OttesenSCG-928-E16]
MNVLSFVDGITNWEVEIVRAIQAISNGFFDFIFKTITILGDQYFFIVLVALLYWIVDKKFAHKFAMGFIASSVVTGVVKVAADRLRPYQAYPYNETTKEGVKLIGPLEESSSFPSGHSTSTGSISSALFMGYNKKFKWLKWVLLAYMILIPISRLYLGVHYPTDVLTGLAIGVLVTFVTFKIVEKMGDKEHIWSLGIAGFFILAVILLESFLKNILFDDLTKQYDSLHDIYLAAGGFSAFLIGYYFEKKYVQMDVNNILLFQILKGVIGLGVAFGIQKGVGALFDLIQVDNLLLDFIRYFMIGIWAALLAPMLFKKLFSKKGNPNGDSKEELLEVNE